MKTLDEKLDQIIAKCRERIAIDSEFINNTVRKQDVSAFNSTIRAIESLRHIKATQSVGCPHVVGAILALESIADSWPEDAL